MAAQPPGTEPGTSDSEPSPLGSEAEISESSLKIISHGVVWIYKNRPTPLTPGATAAVRSASVPGAPQNSVSHLAGTSSPPEKNR